TRSKPSTIFSGRRSQADASHRISLKSRSINLLHLIEAQLDRDLALKDVHEHLQLLLVRIDVHDLAVEVGQRAGGDLHRLAERELDLRARPLTGGCAGAEDPVDLALRERHGLGAGA